MLNQREDVAVKYESIYRLVESEVLNHLSTSKESPVRTYGTAKLTAAAAWHMAVWLGANPGASRERQFDQVVEFLNQPMTWLENGIEKSGPCSAHIISTSNFIAAIAKEHAAGCDLVLDLGCGWGHRMGDMFLAGVEATFYGGDRSKSSERLVQAISELLGMPAHWFRFDFMDPDYSRLPDARKILVFTAFAIEQVTMIGTTMFDRLFARFPNSEIVGLHFEPISFQIDPDRSSARTNSEKLRYNQDLFGVLQSHPEITVTTAAPASIDYADGVSTASVAWRRNPSRGLTSS